MMRVRIAFDMGVDKPADAAKVLEKMLASVDASAVEHFSWTMKGQEPFFAEFAKPITKRRSRVARDAELVHKY